MNGSGAEFTEKDWYRLLADIEDRRVIPVVGPELLTLNLDGEETTLFDHLARELAGRLGIEIQRPKSATVGLGHIAAQYLRQAESEPEDLYREIKRLMTKRLWPTPEPLKKLAAIRHFDLYVSTTFDSLLEQALKENRQGARAFAYSKMSEVVDLPADAGPAVETAVYQIFGRLGPMRDYAVTEEDVTEFSHRLQVPELRPQRLFDRLRTSHLLVLGCSFPGWLSRFFLRTVKGEQLFVQGAPGVVADDLSGRDTGLVLFLERQRTRVYSEGDALQFVNELHRRWTKEFPEAPAPEADPPGAGGEPPPFKPGSVFLSYASEDRVVARRIRHELDAAGIDVWFDERDLEPGDPFRKKIEQHIRHCSFFVPLISRSTLTAEPRFFRREWTKAIDVAPLYPDGYPFIQPVAIDDTPENAATIPEEFNRRHWERVKDGRLSAQFIERMRQRLRAREIARRSA